MKYQLGMQELKSVSEEQKLLEFLSRGHFLPSFNLPIDAVPFIARTSVGGNEQIVARMSDGLEKALQGYAPGKELTYKKKDFVVGGIYIEYTPKRDVSSLDAHAAAKIRTDEAINRTKYWFENKENINYFHMCKICKHTLPFTSQPPGEVESLNSACPVCSTSVEEKPWLSLPTIRPPGFAPLIRTTSTKGFSEVDNPTYSQDTKTFHSRTRWPSSLITKSEPERMELVEGRVELLYHKKIQILDINAGSGSIEEPESMGFAFCKDCGHMTHTKSIKPDHLRPYAIVRDDGMFAGAFAHEDLTEQFTSQMDGMCSSTSRSISDHSRLLLGRLFTTNVLSLRIKWDSDRWISLSDDKGRKIGQRSAMTVCQAFLQAICDAETNYAISSNDLGGDIRQTEDHGFEIFIYERVDGGAGLLKDVYSHISDQWGGIGKRGTILEKLTSILDGTQCLRSEMFPDNVIRTVSKPCDSICHGCLQDFSTQHISAELNRELGSQFFELGLGNYENNHNHHEAARHLNYLVKEILGDGGAKPQPIIDEGNTKFTVHPESPEIPGDKVDEWNQAWKGILVGDCELLIDCEIIESKGTFATDEIIRNPIETSHKLRKILAPHLKKKKKRKL
jgi:hypothetical protein